MMPHIDDGTLHALMDGALRAEDPGRADEVERHLAECEDCRARLDQAARLRDDASRVLAHATPAGTDTAADFDDVLARADRPRATRRHADVRRQLGWTRGIAWAATLVLALGTGYLLRDMVGPDGAPTVQRSADRAAQEAPAQEAPGGEAPMRDAPARQPSAREAVEPQREAPTPEPERDHPTASAPAPSPAPPPAPSPERMERAEQADEEAAMARTRLPAEALMMTGEAAGAGADAGAGEAAAREAVRWVAATVEEARAALDGPLYVLPRAALIAVYTEGTDDAPAVLSLQRLESGVPVRVVQRRPSPETAAETAEGLRPQPAGAAGIVPTAAADTAGPALPGTETARVTRGEFELVLEATLPAELLAILGEGARPFP